MDRILAHFLGDWHVSRDIVQGDGSRARFTGVAVWAATADGADYAERGVLDMGTASFNAERRYRWTTALSVYFDDGRFFHAVPRCGGSTGHWCDPDQYDVHYDFSQWPVWTVHWKVCGPRKDYTMTTVYRRDLP